MLPIPEDDIIPETIKIPDTITSADTSSHHNSRNLPRVFLSNDGKCSLTFDTAETIKALIAPYTSLGDFSFTYECVV